MTKNIWINLLTTLAQISKAKFIHQTKNIEATQRKFLIKLLRLYQNTELGKNFDFKTLKTVEQFRERIPILPYTYYEPYIDRMMAGENNILTPDKPIYFNFTSGTTAKQKIIPVTKKSYQFKELTKFVSVCFLVEVARNKNIIIDKTLLTSSLQLFGQTKNGIPYGPVSAGDLHLGNFFQKNIFAHPYDALKITDILARNYVCLLFALSHPNLSIIAANYPVIALSLAEYLEKYASELIEDLKTGKIADWLKIEPKLRRQLEKKWKTYPQRAKQLEEILKREGHLTPKLAWSSLGCIVTARGTPSNFYFQKFPDYFAETPIFGGLYASAEAVFGIYSEFDNDASILAINSNFFEFIPVSEWEKENPQTQLPHQVKIGERYRILVSNHTGLYRYDIGDIIKVIGFYNQTPMITFLHRAKGILSSTTEKTTDFHAITIVQELQKKFKLSLENFCVTLSEDGFPPAYILNIELHPDSDLQEPEFFLKQFDLKLQELNTCYKIERTSAIPSPLLRILAPGSFAQLTQRLIAKGMPESQVKILNLNPNRQYLSGLKVIQEFQLS